MREILIMHLWMHEHLKKCTYENAFSECIFFFLLFLFSLSLFFVKNQMFFLAIIEFEKYFFFDLILIFFPLKKLDTWNQNVIDSTFVTLCCICT